MRNVYRQAEPVREMIDEVVLAEALDRVVACQECSGSLSRTFRSVLTEALGGAFGSPNLGAMAQCPNCSSLLLESSLVRCEGDDLGDFSPSVLPGYSAWLH